MMWNWVRMIGFVPEGNNRMKIFLFCKVDFIDCTWNTDCSLWWFTNHSRLLSSLGFGWWDRVDWYFSSIFFSKSNLVRFRITILGCSARYLAALEEHQITPRTHNRLNTLHTILSTGSPLHSRTFDYVYSDIKSDVLLGSITGGTDIM